MDRVVHFEIPAGDVERAKKFYSDNFGWKLNQLGADMGNYVLVQTGPSDEQGMPQDRGFINGGLMPRDPSASSPVLVIAVARPKSRRLPKKNKVTNKTVRDLVISVTFIGLT